MSVRPLGVGNLQRHRNLIGRDVEGEMLDDGVQQNRRLGKRPAESGGEIDLVATQQVEHGCGLGAVLAQHPEPRPSDMAFNVAARLP